MGNLVRGEPKAGRIYILLYLRPFHSFCGYAGSDCNHGQKRRAWTVMENRRGKTKTDIDRNSWLSAGLDSILRFIHVLSSYRNSTSEVRRSYGEHHIGNRLQTEIYMESMGLHLCDAVRSIHGNGN